MNDVNDGGPAFPRPFSEHAGGGYCHTEQDGMSLRDWFAGKAMASMISSVEFDNMKSDEMATLSYYYADAMLAERAKGSQ